MLGCLYRANVEAQVECALHDSSIDVYVLDGYRLMLDNVPPDATIIVQRHHLVRG